MFKRIILVWALIPGVVFCSAGFAGLDDQGEANAEFVKALETYKNRGDQLALSDVGRALIRIQHNGVATGLPPADSLTLDQLEVQVKRIKLAAMNVCPAGHKVVQYAQFPTSNGKPTLRLDVFYAGDKYKSIDDVRKDCGNGKVLQILVPDPAPAAFR